MNFTKQSVIDLLLDAEAKGTLHTYKHSESSISDLSQDDKRDIISVSASDRNFISSGDFTLEHYKNTSSRYHRTPDLFVITPNSNTGLSYPASAITASTNAVTPLEKLVVASGSVQGVHYIRGINDKIIADLIKDHKWDVGQGLLTDPLSATVVSQQLQFGTSATKANPIPTIDPTRSPMDAPKATEEEIAKPGLAGSADGNPNHVTSRVVTE